MANETIDKIIADLKQVERIAVTFYNAAKVSEIERDIALSKLRSIYENIQFLEVNKPLEKVVNKTEPIIGIEHILEIISEEEIIETEIIPEVKVEKTIIVIPEIINTPIAKVVEKPVSEIEIPNPDKPEIAVPAPAPEIKQPYIPKQPEIPVQQPEEIPVQKPSENPEPKHEDKSFEYQSVVHTRKTETTTILAEKFQQNKSFLHDALSKYQSHADISHKYQTKPINDIFTAISLNEKYLYIKELFNNDPAFYKNTIERLNSFDNFNQAVAFLDEHFKWDFNDFQVQKIIELVHRRYFQVVE